MEGSVPLDWQLHNTYFNIAHIHYVVGGTVVFALLSGIYYWVPKMWGRMLNETLGKIGFWAIFIGFNLTFFPMHIVGLLGMPRRVYTYPDGLGWGAWNLVETLGSYIMGAGLLVVVLDFFLAMRRGEPAPDNPWNADTLEWAVSSPPPPYNFLNIPTVTSREPLWDQPELSHINDAVALSMIERPAGSSTERETVITSVLEAESPETVQMPGDSYWPLLLAFGLLVLFIGFLPNVAFAEFLIIGVGALITFIATLGWFWPEPQERAT